MDKRLKRHIKAPNHTFLIQGSSDFKTQLRAELESFEVEIKEAEHGFYISCKLSKMYELAIFLRTASRISMVLDLGRCGSVEELYKKSLALNLDLYISNSRVYKLKSFVRNSRIKHEGAALKTFRESLTQQRYEVSKEGDLLSLYIISNHAELRIDAVGDHLHKRGYRLDHGLAPIRETLAASLIKWAGIDTSKRVLDPMCGSGTFLYEYYLYRNPRTILGERSYVFQHWPCYLNATFKHLKSNLEKSNNLELFGFDTDSQVLKKADSLANEVGLFISFTSNNIFDNQSEYPGVDYVLVNPPYGQRLNFDDPQYYKRLFHCITTKIKAQVYLILIPLEFKSQIPKPDRWKDFKNGGIKMRALLYIRK